ncbi:hypothetical protein FRC08_009955, partial [Ceratobasidium sp. 394]
MSSSTGNGHDPEETHLFVTMVSDAHFYEYEGFGLAGYRGKTYSPNSGIPTCRVAVARGYDAFKQDVIGHLKPSNATDIRFWGLHRRCNGTLRPDTLLEKDLTAWKSHWAGRRPRDPLLVYVESITDITGRLPDPPNPDSVLIFFKYFDVAKQRLYGVGKTNVSWNLKTSDLINIINKMMSWQQHKELQLYEEIKPGMIENLLLNRTLLQNEIINGDIICFQEVILPVEKDILRTRFPGFIVDAVDFYKEMQKPTLQATKTPARAFDFYVLPQETFSDALKRIQEQMGLLNKDLSKYRF